MRKSSMWIINVIVITAISCDRKESVQTPAPRPTPSHPPEPSPHEVHISDAKKRILDRFPSPSSVAFITAESLDVQSGGEFNYAVVGTFDGQSQRGAEERWSFIVNFVDADNGWFQIKSRRTKAEGGEILQGFFGHTQAQQRQQDSDDSLRRLMR